MEDLNLLILSYRTNLKNNINMFIDVDIHDSNELSQDKSLLQTA